MDRILKQYETLLIDKVHNNTNNKSRKETYVNKHSDMQSSHTQGHTINIVPNNRELTENIEQTVCVIVSDRHMNKKMITSTLEHTMAGSAGDRTNLHINKLHMHIQTVNIAQTVNAVIIL